LNNFQTTKLLKPQLNFLTLQNQIQGFVESILVLLPAVAATLVGIAEFPLKASWGNLQDLQICASVLKFVGLLDNKTVAVK